MTEEQVNGPAKIWLPEPKEPPPKLHVVLAGSRGLRSHDDGYYGDLIVRKGKLEVRVLVTMRQYETLAKMGIEEYT